MFVTRALAATALAGMAFGLSAPIAFADTAAVSYGDCGHHWKHDDHGKGDDHGRGDNGRGDNGGRDNGGRDNGGRDNGGRDNGGRDNGGRESQEMGGGDSTANQYNDSDQSWTVRDGGSDHGDHRKGDDHGWGHHCKPSHGADTGLGGSITGMNTTQTALGGGLLATAVAGGGVYLRRRKGFNA